MRIILRQLGLPLQNINRAVKFVRAASITDSYWIREAGSSLQWKNVKFTGNQYMKAALYGDPDIFTLDKEVTPEITNIGSFNKGWRLENGEWFLYKTGKPLEIFSELFTSLLSIELGLNAVRYNIQDSLIKCKNFVTDNWDYEPAKSLIGDNISYERNIEVMKPLGLLKEYMDLIFMDAIVRNADRHEFNYGFLTNIDGAILLAPNFGNNLSLFCTGIPANLERKDPTVSEFCAVHSETDYKIPAMNEDTIAKIYRQAIEEYPVDVSADIVVEFCMNAYKQIK